MNSASVCTVPRGRGAVPRGGSGTAGRTGLGKWLGYGGSVVNPVWRDGDVCGIGEVLVVEGTVDDGDECVSVRFGAAKTVGREVDGLVEGNVALDHSFPVEPPVGPFPLGNDEEDVSLILADFLQDVGKEGPVWVEPMGCQWWANACIQGCWSRWGQLCSGREVGDVARRRTHRWWGQSRSRWRRCGR